MLEVAFIDVFNDVFVEEFKDVLDCGRGEIFLGEFCIEASVEVFVLYIKLYHCWKSFCSVALVCLRYDCNRSISLINEK